MDDAELDRALNEALSVSPSPDFVARVRVTIADTPASADLLGWLGGTTRPAVFSLAVAASIAIAVGIALALRPDPIETADTIQILGSRPITAAAQAPPQGASGVHESRATSSRPRAGHGGSPAMPDVLIAPDNRQALIQLLAGARERRFEATFDETPASTPWVVSELAVAPLTVEPLNAPAAENN